MRLGSNLGRVILEAGEEQFARTIRLAHRVGVNFYGHQCRDRSFVPTVATK
jgi:hypothetical protein